jgi:response regulator RpfG family c-di-GMP phosphodiesterase
MQYKILFVDDETANLRLLERLFRNNYEVLTASSPDEGLEQLSVHDVALIISDQRMPGMTGTEFLKKAAEMRPQTVRIILTGYTDASDLVDAINSGVVYRYVTKPWVNEELQQTVKRALQHYETLKAQRQLQLHNERLQARLKATKDGFIDVLMTMLDTKIPRSREHAERTAKYAVALGEQLGLERSDLESLSLAARLYEAALFRIPNNVVLKQSILTAQEAECVNENLRSGLEMLEAVPDFDEIVDVLRYQFERFDGSGTPLGFSGDQIPLAARIVSVAGSYDNLRNPRADSATMEHDDAMRLLKYEAGRKFDPQIIEALCEVCRAPERAEAEEMLLVF